MMIARRPPFEYVRRLVGFRRSSEDLQEVFFFLFIAARVNYAPIDYLGYVLLRTTLVVSMDGLLLDGERERERERGNMRLVTLCSQVQSARNSEMIHRKYFKFQVTKR